MHGSRLRGSRALDFTGAVRSRRLWSRVPSVARARAGGKSGATVQWCARNQRPINRRWDDFEEDTCSRQRGPADSCSRGGRAGVLRGDSQIPERV